MLSKEEYIRKHYLGGGERGDASNGTIKKRKEKKRRKRGVPRMKIIDDSESGWTKRNDDANDDNNDPSLEDDLPAVAEIVDERPEEEVILETYRSSDRWKTLGNSQKQRGATKDSSFSKRHDSSDASHPRKQRHDSSDASPPRKQRHDSSDASPPRKQRHDSSDASPPRKQRHDSSDASPPRKQRHDSSDASPPRKQRQDSSDASPPRKRHDSSDASPPRKQRQDSSDASPPRKRHDSSDASPPRKRHDSSDASPPTKRHDSSDASPPRKRAESTEAKSRNRNETVYRDRETGKKKELNKDLEMKQNLIVAKVERFRSGILQQQKKEQCAADALHEMGKSFTRSKGDADLEEHLKKHEHEEDPMAQFLRKKNKGKAEAERPKYKGAWPANRFNIPPGYRWDGVDRSNGFEKKYFSSINERKAVSEIAHKWSVEDM